MSVNDSLDGIISYYEKVSLPELTNEFNYYSGEETRQIKNYLSQIMFNWSLFDSYDKQHWRNFFWKCFYITMVSTGINKVCNDQDLQKVIRFKPSWNESPFVKFVKFKKGILFVFACTAFLIPDLSMNLLRPAVKRYHVINYLKDQDKIAKVLEMKNAANKQA